MLASVLDVAEVLWSSHRASLSYPNLFFQIFLVWSFFFDKLFQFSTVFRFHRDFYRQENQKKDFNLIANRDATTFSFPVFDRKNLLHAKFPCDWFDLIHFSSIFHENLTLKIFTKRRFDLRRTLCNISLPSSDWLCISCLTKHTPQLLSHATDKYDWPNLTITE